MHQVVEANAVLEQVVDTTHDAEDTEGEDPHTDDSDNVSQLAALEETPDTEAGGKDIDNQDGTSDGELRHQQK